MKRPPMTVKLFDYRPNRHRCYAQQDVAIILKLAGGVWLLYLIAAAVLL